VATLTDRLEELMRVQKWTRADVLRISGVSSSVLSQWMGKGSKVIKTIGDMKAATKLSEASGYNALWIAKGEGPKHVSAAPKRPAAKFTDRHEVLNESDWALLQDAKMLPPKEVDALRARAAEMREIYAQWEREARKKAKSQP
jgi:transcriptional regulator with XRE-family HTH domain